MTRDTYSGCFEQGTLSRRIFLRDSGAAGNFFLLPLPFLKSVAKCHVSQKSEPGSPRESEVSVVTCDTYRECFEQGALSRRIFLRGTTAVEKNSSVVFTLFEISS